MPTIQYYNYARMATNALSRAFGISKKEPAINKALLFSGAAIAIAAAGYGANIAYDVPPLPFAVPQILVPPPPLWNRVVDFCTRPLFNLGAVFATVSSWGIWKMRHPVRPLAVAVPAVAAPLTLAQVQKALAAAARDHRARTAAKQLTGQARLAALIRNL